MESTCKVNRPMWQLGEFNYSDKQILCCFRLLHNKWSQTWKLKTAFSYFLAICRSDVQAHSDWVLFSASHKLSVETILQLPLSPQMSFTRKSSPA